MAKFYIEVQMICYEECIFILMPCIIRLIVFIKTIQMNAKNYQPLHNML